MRRRLSAQPLCIQQKRQNGGRMYAKRQSKKSWIIERIIERINERIEREIRIVRKHRENAGQQRPR